MVRATSAAHLCVALALVAAAGTASAAAGTTSSDAAQWTNDYKSWIEDIKTSVAGNANLEQKAAQLQSTLDAAVTAGVSEADRMRLLYDFLIVADSDPTFTGFAVKDTAAATTAPAAASAASATCYTALASLSTVALIGLSYALL